MQIRLRGDTRIAVAKIVQVIHSELQEVPTWLLCQQKLQESTGWTETRTKKAMGRAVHWYTRDLKEQ